MSRPTHPPRSVHAVPASSGRFIARAPTLEADEVVLDLEGGPAR